VVVHNQVPSVTTAATFTATIVDEWVRAGVEHAVVSPGSRSTPLALALAAERRLRVHVHQDERAASFTALGIATSTGLPVIMLTTSGTAAAETHAAVVEADLGRVPLIVCTADRPPELRHVGAPQTIDQDHLFGRAVRWFCDPGVPDEEGRGAWRSLAARAFAEATGPPSGPVHLNLPFRDPLVGSPGELPPGRSGGRPWHERIAAPRRIDHRDAVALANLCRGRRGVIVAGAGIRQPEHVLLLAHALAWPVLAEPRSGCRVPDRAVVAYFDALVRTESSERKPDVVLRLGAPPASKALAQWLASLDGHEVLVDRDGWWLDPAHTAASIVEAEPSIACAELAPLLEHDAPSDDSWLTSWTEADQLAGEAIERVLRTEGAWSEVALARSTVAAMPDDSALVVSSSMPVRDVEWFSEPRELCRVLANRGANGIDGVVSTAVGVALTGQPTAALVGDLAFLHDLNGLLGAADREIDLTVVVIDNDGGGIFSFLPQADAIDTDRFEQLFGTPHGVDVGALAAGHGARVHAVGPETPIDEAMAKSVGIEGVDVIVARTDRADNVRVHGELQSAVAVALAGR
jgi:2-succinyl-5-enolpyruvyl-6-hydroxy-3-cyclohexene-1-carboxylate synthase